MSDRRMRELERQAAAGDPQAAARLERAQERAQVRVARYWLTVQQSAKHKRHLVHADARVVGRVLTRASCGDQHIVSRVCSSPSLCGSGWLVGAEWTVLGDGGLADLCQRCFVSLGGDDPMTLWMWQLALGEVLDVPYPPQTTEGELYIGSELANAQSILAAEGRFANLVDITGWRYSAMDWRNNTACAHEWIEWQTNPTCRSCGVLCRLDRRLTKARPPHERGPQNKEESDVETPPTR